MIPSRLFPVALPFLLLFCGLPLSAQVAEDVRLSPDDRPATVSPLHRSASSVSLGAHGMVAWGKTELDSIQQQRGVLMLGHLDGREWTAPPTDIEVYDPGESIAVQLVAIDSLFLVIWKSGEKETRLYARAYHSNGRPATDRIDLGQESLTGIWALPGMPGVAFVRREGLPSVSLEYRNGDLVVREVNRLFEPGLSFRIDRDTALWAITDGELLHFTSIYDTLPDWRMSAPKADSQAAFNHPFIATVSDGGFSMVLLSTYFSEGYSRYGLNDTVRARVVVQQYDRDRNLSREETLWSMADVFGTAVNGFGNYITHRGARTHAYCDGGHVIYLELESQGMRAGSPSGLATTIRRGVEISADGEIRFVQEGNYPASSVVCTPEGTRNAVQYMNKEGTDYLSVDLVGGDLVFNVGSEQPTTARSNPRLVEKDGIAYIVWREKHGAERLRMIEKFSKDGMVVVDVQPPLSVPELPDNHGCFPYSEEHIEVEGPGTLVENSVVWRVCQVIGAGNSQQIVSVIYPGSRILVVDAWKYRSHLKVISFATEYSSGSGSGYFATGVEPDDRTILVTGGRLSVFSSSLRQPWVKGIMNANGDFLWEGKEEDLYYGNPLPTGGQTWASFSGDTLRLMDASRLRKQIFLPRLFGRGTMRFQSLPGSWVARTFETVEGGVRSLMVQLVEYDLGFVTEKRLELPENGATLPYILTHPGDGSRFILWGGTDGIYATRYTRNLDSILMPPTRISETVDSASNPSATFINDTLTVVWEDHRHGIPAIYGLQWKVEAVEGTNSVDREPTPTPATLDLSWRKSSTPSEPME